MIGRFQMALQSVREYCRSRRTKGAGGEKEVIQGSAGNVIIVKSPNTEYFKEAIFILRDDLFTRRGVSRQQLLHEAHRAASEYIGGLAGARDLTALRYLFFFLLGAASSLGTLMLLGYF